MDEVKKYLACDGRVSVIIANTTNMIEEYRKSKNLTPTTTAVMGRFLTIAGMMGHTDMKSDKETMTLQIKGGGPVGTLITTIKKEQDIVKLKSYIQNPTVELDVKENGKIDKAKILSLLCPTQIYLKCCISLLVTGCPKDI